MPIVRAVGAFLSWPGNTICRIVGQDPMQDSGMLRGFANSIAWGLVAVIVLVLTQ
jgi:hypothetical protein